MCNEIHLLKQPPLGRKIVKVYKVLKNKKMADLMFSAQNKCLFKKDIRINGQSKCAIMEQGNDGCSEISVAHIVRVSSYMCLHDKC